MLSKIEILKAKRPPLEIIKDIYDEASGKYNIEQDKIDLLKWYGMYPHANRDNKEEEKYFMKRVKLKDGKIDKNALKILSKIGLKYAKGYIDFTTRQNIQFHYIQIKDLPKIFKSFEGTDLTSRLASGDAPRKIVSCPVSGIDKNEIIDTTPLVKELDSFFDSHAKDYSNLPRKFKIGIGGCKCHCINHEIQDVAFTAFNANGKVLFDLTIGGGLAKSKRFASRANRYIRFEQVKDVTIAICEIFKEFGNRKNRSKARVRHLLEEWGMEKFVDEIEKRVDFELIKGYNEPNITPSNLRGHYGIHKFDQYKNSYIGCATNRGRLSGYEFQELYRLVDKYDADGISLTTSQNFIVYGIDNDNIYKFEQELNDIGFKTKLSAFEFKTQSCTGLPFCKFAATQTKDFTSSLISYLEKRFPRFDKNISLAVSGCPNGCSHPYIADIGLIGTKIKTQHGRVGGYEVFLGGKLSGENNSKFAESTNKKLQVSEINEYIGDIIEKRF